MMPMRKDCVNSQKAPSNEITIPFRQDREGGLAMAMRVKMYPYHLVSQLDVHVVGWTRVQSSDPRENSTFGLRHRPHIAE